jgi:hypothetical protein
MKMKKFMSVLLSFVLAIVIAVAPISAGGVYADCQNFYEYAYINLDDMNFIEPFDFETYIAALDDEYEIAEMLYIRHRMNAQADAVEAYGHLMYNFLTMVDGNLDLVYPTTTQARMWTMIRW